ncbi:hypothetical protein [Paenibacillus xylaniclasticus]|uniref:hypothetical protein n=1 Tax=Paenibacillus xylaniclasticus TaxID=588083 RepID=UPI000FDB02CB|nr:MULTISPECIES: hypothetical protein [Paenibacillus]GFN30994.1 hypothetical protein PCURB6_12540 [Paenibacillus curdlanolyticus]
MEWIFAALAAAGAAVLGWFRTANETAARAEDGAAALSVLAVSAVAGAGIVRTVRHGTLYMTEIHSVLVSPVIWIGGSYLVVYTISRLAAALFSASERSW